MSNDNSLFGGMQRLLNPTIYREAADAPNLTRGDKPQDETNDPNAGSTPVIGDVVRWGGGDGSQGIIDRIVPDGRVADVESSPVLGTQDDPALRISVTTIGPAPHYVAMRLSQVKRVQVTGEQAVQKAQLRESLAEEMKAHLTRFQEAHTANDQRPVIGDTVSYPGGMGKVIEISMTGPLAGSQGKSVSGTTADPALLLHVVRGGMLSSPVVTEAVLASTVHRIAATGNEAIALREAAVTEIRERIARTSERAELGRRAEQAAARARALFAERAAWHGGSSRRPAIRYDD